MNTDSAKFVWYDREGKGRNRFAAFRRTFALRSKPEKALVQVFADTSYQLFVNGVFVQFGPVRFDVRNPQFDTHDIAQYLKSGDNVIAVLVKSFGCKTFKDNSVQGGFIAWGELTDDDGTTIELATSKDSDWRVKRYEAFDPNAAKMSFALETVDVFDQEKDEADWLLPEFDDSGWSRTVELEDQSVWGELSARTIPFMDLQPVPIELYRQVEPLSDREVCFGYSLPTPSFHGEIDIFEGRDTMAFATATWIHSPRDQNVVFGLYWGRYFVNGVECEAAGDTDRLRKDFVLPLKEGWNAFVAMETVIDDGYTFYIAFPKASGVSLSANKEAGDSSCLLYSGPHDPKELESVVEKRISDADSIHLGLEKWIDVEEEHRAINAGRRSQWDQYEAPIESVTAEELVAGKSFSIDQYPNGFSVSLDFGQMRLVLPHLELEGAVGAEVDLCYNEHLTADKTQLLQNPVYTSGDRIYPTEAVCRFRPSQPRGTRYLRLTVRGAKSDVTLRNLEFLSCHYPVTRLGHFSCSDPLLNSIWEMCERTQQANMEDVFVDCSGRERGMYLRDVIIQFHNGLAAYGDTQLMGRCMELYGQSPDHTGKFRCVYPNKGDYTIADFAIEAIDGYWQYYLASGDLDRLRDDWPAMLGSMQWFHDLSDEREDGLLNADWPELHGVESAYGGLHGDNGVEASEQDKTGPNANLTFPYVLMLESAILIARELGELDEADRLSERLGRVRSSAVSCFWNEELGCFNDNLAGGTQSPHASILAVVSKSTNTGQEERIREHLSKTLSHVFLDKKDPENGARFSPAYSFFIFQGLYALGLSNLAESLIRQGWGWFLEQGAVTTPEFFHFKQSHCHAWSASPMYYLSKEALGVRFPDAPNFSKVKIEIQSDLKFAEGAFPFPGTDEAVEVKWRRDASGKIEGMVRAPKRVKVEWDSERFNLFLERIDDE
ncbi:alpha-L-rhamnosidase N-terminal domain-containing protein [Pelagicoccus mobilis]|uniref:Alpha-L-rhamnosidase N-terminal domain-containing protein n=1 Tax=Pelagicoccus mobilis TaxID=415221 RepID=A0A934S218_9BACT|nr:alpha-L-rhamnosidase N-terminal domain-containing protein [Pelagicoccus mobilis]MBK1879735.1 alpha-L-rhamnosidase N-terminal domain-containing protein [Pelagicoccus mobilis]